MVNNWDKFLLLMWKNWILQIRSKKQTIMEILTPIFFSVLLVVIRHVSDPEFNDERVYKPYCPILWNTSFLCDPTAEGDDFAKPTNFQNLTLIYAPNTSIAIDRVMVYFRPFFKDVVGFLNSDEIDSYYAIQSSNVTAAGIVFNNQYADTVDPKELSNLKIQIRFPSELRTESSSIISWFTNLIFPAFQLPGPRNPYENTGASPSYYGEGFLSIQHYLTLALSLAQNNVSLDDVSTWIESHQYPYISMRRFAYAAWYDDTLLTILSTMLPLIFVLSFAYTCLNIIRSITVEKEKQLKESMKIMGLPNWLHWTAWFTKCFIILAISDVLIVVLLKVKWSNKYGVLTYADPTVLYVFLLIYSCSVITLGFAVSTLFSKANNAVAASGFIWFMCYIPYNFLVQNYDTLSLAAKLSVSLLQNSAMSFGCRVILMYEGTADGISWSTLFTPNTVDDDLSLGLIMIMLILDTFLYLGIALYIEAVFPGEYGVAQPWYFLFTKSYWTGIPPIDTDDKKYGNENKEFFESEPTNLHAGVKINNLCKSFDNKVAVDNLTLNMYQDQITVLLGHNGAGKTTTMSMLTGMITPSRGTANINGNDIVKNISGVRQSLGLCPQHNVIFDNLTVAEHLRFFSKLKGLKDESLQAEISKYVKLLDFEDKKNAMSSTLSGGMKRKLSVGIALCGNSQVVMLDEPTSGMDPSARRVLWDLIEKEKTGRTILLTTHFMDEADILGDRIAIMAGGELQCCGSSFFLKKKYGTGYQLIMEKTKSCDVIEVTKLLKRYIPDLEVDRNVGSELSYLLSEMYSSVFEPMLRHLESESERLGIRSYGISLTTMEEVFMKVGADHQREQEDSEYNHGYTNVNLNITASPSYTTGGDLIWNQFYAMFLKRLVSFKRSWFLLLVQVFLPSLFLIISILIESPNSQTTLPAVQLSLSTFEDPVTLLQNTSGNTLDAYVEAYQQLVKFKKTDNMTETLLRLTTTMPTTVRRRYIVGADFEIFSNIPAITAYFNNEPYHSPGITLSLVLNSVLKAFSNCSNCSIDFVNYPLKFTADSQINKSTQMNQIAFNIGFGMAFVSAFFVMFIVREIVTKSKHLQFASGLKVPVFWISHLICDLLVFVLIVTIFVIVLICFQKDGYNTPGDIGRMILIFLYFACSVLPVIYLLAYLFKIPSEGYGKIMLFSIFTGTIPFIVILILKQIGNLKDVGNSLHWVFLLSPWYSMMSGISETYNTHVYYKLCSPYFAICPSNMSIEQCLDISGPLIKSICIDADGDYFKWKSPGIGRNLLYSFVEAACLFTLLIIIEYKYLSKIIYSIIQKLFPKYPIEIFDEDSDVAEERNRIRNSTISELQSENLVVTKDLTKYYGKFLAVNGICLSIKHYECFGLLGENGAGKTTTFKMLTGDESITYGDGWVNNISVQSNPRNVQKIIGYCPQFDALLDDMTGKETLIMFALIRGIQYQDCKSISQHLSNEFDFTAHLNKKVKEMSGGNKRKLSTALTLIGDPQVLYLDEPTTGMDPATKRYLWSALCRLRDSGKSMVLTSHSMEECEALCTKMAIMVKGNFKCLGSTQHLKNKFAQGYSLSIKIKKRPDSSGHHHADTTTVERFITAQFPSAVLKEKHEELLTYQIIDFSLPWSRMFGILEDGKRTLPEIEDYSLGQCTLEQVFLTFTNKSE